MKIRKGMILLTTMLLMISVFSACNLKPTGGQAADLITYKSYTQIKKLIDKSIKNATIAGRMYGAAANAIQEGGVKTTADAQSGTSGKTEDYSTTNIQVAGVDEADAVKTDGTYLYILANGRLVIVDAQEPASMKIVSQIQYLYASQPEKNTVTPIELFLDETNKLLTLVSYSYDDRQAQALLTEAATGTVKPSADSMMPGYYSYWGYQNVLVQVIDLKDITKPSVIREFLQEGTYISSRRINEFVYVITNKYLYYYSDTQNKDYYIPAVKDSEAGETWEMLPVESISVIENQACSNFIVLSAINTKVTTTAVQTKAILGSGDKIYASPSNIYVASTRYTYQPASSQVTESGAAVTAVPGETSAAQKDGTAVGSGTATVTGGAVTSGGTASASGDVVIPSDTKDVFKIFEAPVYTVFTDIYRFEIKDATISPKGSGVVPGYVLNQFAMDEYNGYFRIATTTGDSWRSDQYTSMNNVYILDASLKVAGKIEGLATRETIKSVRFMGTKAYLVTFRTVDPLFVLDLSDPAKPLVKGELKIPGYSEYLHPISDTLVIGFGKDAMVQNDMAFYLGVKVSVFDVSNLTSPKEISSMIIGGRGTYTELAFNHKALLYSKDKNIIGFPITIYQVPPIQQSDPFAYGVPTFTGYLVLGLTSDNKLYERGRVSHYSLQIPEGYTTQTKDRPETWIEFEKMYVNSYLYTVSRGMYIGNTLFTVSNAMVKANSLADFKDIGKMDLPGFNENYYYNSGIEPARK